MEQKTNIRTLDSSIFLREGAFVRWKGQWFVFQGPFEILESENSQVFSIACIDFFGSKPSLFKSSTCVSLDSASWHSLFKPESTSRSYNWSGPSRELYSKSFALVQSRISASHWKKAVPIAFDRCPGTLQEQEKLRILARLADTPDTLIPYGFWKDGKGMMGLTPEILFFHEGDTIQTMALAGTEKKAGPCHLLRDEKNLKEHHFVVQELFEKLRTYGKVSATGPQILELPTLYHLLTRFDVALEDRWNDLEALTRFHPTSALGVAPFTKWRELEELPEQRERGYFGSPFLVHLGGDRSLALVALRQIQWDEHEIRIGAGGGVVQESQEELEWHEILAKMDSVKKLMGIA